MGSSSGVGWQQQLAAARYLEVLTDSAKYYPRRQAVVAATAAPGTRDRSAPPQPFPPRSFSPCQADQRPAARPASCPSTRRGERSAPSAAQQPHTGSQQRQAAARGPPARRAASKCPPSSLDPLSNCLAVAVGHLCQENGSTGTEQAAGAGPWRTRSRVLTAPPLMWRARRRSAAAALQSRSSCPVPPRVRPLPPTPTDRAYRCTLRSQYRVPGSAERGKPANC